MKGILESQLSVKVLVEKCEFIYKYDYIKFLSLVKIDDPSIQDKFFTVL